MSRPTRLELFAAFTAQFPLLTRDDLEAIVEDMRKSSGFDRMLEHARAQAEAIGLLANDLAIEAPDAADAEDAPDDRKTQVEANDDRAGAPQVRASGFHPIRRVAI